MYVAGADRVCVPPDGAPAAGRRTRIEDSVGLSSHDTGSFLGIRFNPYVAVPSMHVGWAMLVGVYGFRSAGHGCFAPYLFCIHSSWR